MTRGDNGAFGDCQRHHRRLDSAVRVGNNGAYDEIGLFGRCAGNAMPFRRACRVSAQARRKT